MPRTPGREVTVRRRKKKRILNYEYESYPVEYLRNLIVADGPFGHKLGTSMAFGLHPPLNVDATVRRNTALGIAAAAAFSVFLFFMFLTTGSNQVPPPYFLCPAHGRPCGKY